MLALPPSGAAVPRYAFQASGALHTWPASWDDPVAWRRGRLRYTVWALDLRAPAGGLATPAVPNPAQPVGPGHGCVTASVVQRLAAVQAALGPATLAVGTRQPHITLQVCGFACTTPAQWDDDFDPCAQAAQWRALAALPVAQQRPFTLHIGGPDSYESAAFLRVQDRSAALAPLRRALALAHGEFRAPHTPWQPHLTVGLYRQAMPAAELAQRLDAAAAAIGPTPLALPVHRLLRVDYDARDALGPLDWAGAQVWTLNGAAPGRGVEA